MRKTLLIVCVAGFASTVGLIGAGCNLSVQPGPGGGFFGSFEILGQTFSFSLGDIRNVEVTANQPLQIPVGFRLFDEAPASTPPSGTMRLASTQVGVGRTLSKAIRSARALPLNGSGNIRFTVAAGQDAELCDSAILLSEYDFTYNTGIVAILEEEYDISAQALEVLVANDVTICVSITTDFDALITIDGFDIAFGGSSGSSSGAFTFSNDDAFENIHILTPDETFDPAVNRLTPGASRNVTIDGADGQDITIRAGRNGVVLDTAICMGIESADYQADVSWDGANLICVATQSDSGSGSDDDDDSVPDGTIIQVPVDSFLGFATVAPVTSTIGGVDYGVVGVLYDQTPMTPYPLVESTTLSVDLTDLGLDSVNTIYMAVHSSFVADLPSGVDMGTLTVFYAEGGAPTTLDFSLGGNTAEWSYDRPENMPVPHSLATTLYTFPTTIDSAFEYDGREYAVTLSVDSSRTISCISLLLPSDATYVAFRDAADPDATYASQYVAAMTFEGPSGSPSIVGDCTGVSIPVADCDADGVCDPLCDTGEDPDCEDGATEDCSADGECNDNCTAENPDPDCEEDCSDDGFCNENCSELDPDPDCVVDDSGAMACTATSTFETGDEGWTLLGDAEGGRADPDYIINDGNPGAHISADDDALGGIWYWKAPAKFRGNFADAYGNSLTFDLKQSATDFGLDRRDVILIGDGGTLIWFDTAMNPGTDWTPYSIALNASSGWMLDDDSPASESVIRAVLGTIEDLQIRGEYRNGNDTGGLDNVVFNSGC
ncbi:MAG: hypothetical protein DHS20C16_05330 [Phycisphaerae bacterium]|nr:MAG: hypothetical protein DHS20C16_05330 [Phycisphaerae bacterium]